MMSAFAQGDWQPIDVPAAWETRVDTLAAYDGFAWYRAYVSVPAEWAGSRMLLVAGGIDNVDEAFFNGQKIGANGSMPPLFGNPASSVRRPFVVDPDLVRFGQYNLVAWRVYDHGGKGGIFEGPVHLTRKDDAIDLAGRWLFRTGDSPAWATWDHRPGSPEADREVAMFLNATGDTAAGHRGVVAADVEGRARMIRDVYKRYEGNSNVHATLEGKGDARSVEAGREALRTSPGLTVDTVVAEPIVRQPLYVDFDERGRMWVTQYIQYPNPAGLEVLTWDNHLRKIFDVVPPPPPYRRPEHQKFVGADKITIHEDVDGDGQIDRHKVFLEGMNMVTSTARGRGGVWVLNPPYLLFYPDRDNDDVPDGDPVVHLSGFGLEDTHSIANSLKWGPDGWLYGATGSTVTARVKAPLSGSSTPLVFFGQNIWRYHPDRHEFELFAEGGWNTFGVDFDRKGRLYSGTNGNLQSVYFVQGGYYQKSFGKHGPHTNPYTFGHFYGLPIEGERVRLVHQWIRYDGGAIPGLQDHFVGPDSLANKIHALRIEPDGSTFKTFEIENPIRTDDKWFRPVHVATGPDGAIYISDFYDARITHVDPRDNWDRSNGRIYRLRAEDGLPAAPFDLSARSAVDLVVLLRHPNQWFRDTARRLMADRRDRAVLPTLYRLLRQDDPQLALEALWTIHCLDGLDQPVALQGLTHRDPHVRLWTARLLADSKESLPPELQDAVLALAASDSDPIVISQLAASAQRLPSSQGIPLTRLLVTRDEFEADPYIPQQLWWALEAHISRDPAGVMQMLEDPVLWSHPIFSGTLVERIGRRFMAERSEASLDACARLLGLAPAHGHVRSLIAGMELALQGSSLDPVPPALQAAMNRLWTGAKPDADTIAFALRLGNRESFAVARDFAADKTRDPERRKEMIRALAELKDRDALAVLLRIALKSGSGPDDLRLTAMNALRRFSDDSVANALVAAYPELTGDLQRTAQSILSGRPSWGMRLLRAVDDGDVRPETISFDNLLLLQSRNDPQINAIIQKQWGQLRQPPEVKLKRVDEVRTILATGHGDAAAGRSLFEMACAVCHKLKDIGRDIGPDLTGYERDNLDFLLPAIVDPSLGVREEFELVTLTMKKGGPNDEATLLSGFLTDVAERSVTIKDLVGNRSVVARSDIAAQTRSAMSVMPEGLLEGFSDQQIRDLFAFLRTK